MIHGFGSFPSQHTVLGHYRPASETHSNSGPFLCFTEFEASEVATNGRYNVLIDPALLTALRQLVVICFQVPKFPV